MRVLILLGLPFLCFAVFIAAHVAILHFFPVKRRFTVMLLLMVVACGIFALLFFATPAMDVTGTRNFTFLAGIFLYVITFFFCYQVLLLVDRSVSLRMMIEVRKSGEKGLTEGEIKERYSFDEKFREEVKDMLLIGWVREENGVIRNCRRASLQARVFGFLKDFLNLSKER